MYKSQDPEVEMMRQKIEENLEIIEQTKQAIFRKLAEIIVEREQIAKKVENFEDEMLCKKNRMLQLLQERSNELRKFF